MTVERLLRDAADEVRATVVRDAIPPPFDHGGRGSPVWAKLVAAGVVVVGLAGLAVVLDPSTASDPVEVARPPISSIGAWPTAEVCADIGAVMGGLAEPVEESDRVRTVEHLDRLRGATDHLVDAVLSAEVSRRFDRFVAIADSAVSAAIDGQSAAADERSWQAVALGEALLAEEPFNVCRSALDDIVIDQGG